jgi:catechol 2,3-dioxygenase-like lactoylglutathione lyase family enzyme
MQEAQLRYVIKFVANMDKAVKFHRDVLGLKLKFQSPGWSESAAFVLILVPLPPAKPRSSLLRTWMPAGTSSITRRSVQP